MGITTNKVDEFSVDIFTNLMEKYEYEMSQYELSDISMEGLYVSKNKLKYVNSNTHEAILIYDGNLPIGFIAYYHNDNKHLFSIAELFIIYKYRKNGIARDNLLHIINKFHGKWRIDVHPKNLNALSFWISFVRGLQPNSILVSLDDNRKYKDGANPINIFFNNY